MWATLAHLSNNDHNNVLIGREGGIPLLLKMLSGKSTGGVLLEKLWFCLWNLSFHHVQGAMGTAAPCGRQFQSTRVVGPWAVQFIPATKKPDSQWLIV